MAAVSDEAKQHAKEQQKRWREANRDRVRETNRRCNATCAATYRAKNLEQVRQHQRNYYARNTNTILAKNKVIRDRDDTHSIANKRWAEANKHIKRAISAKRRAQQRQACPVWADHDQIKAIYFEADRLTVSTGIRHVVDHIVPLINDAVCGLHSEHNLQVITAEENGRKGNKFEVW